MTRHLLRVPKVEFEVVVIDIPQVRRESLPKSYPEN